MKKPLIQALIIFIIYSLSVKAQVNHNGLPMYKYFSPNEYKADGQNWTAIKDNAGVMYFGNSLGLLRYDGTNWSLIKTKYKLGVLSLAKDSNNIIYVGSDGEFGAVYPDSTGNLTYHQLSNQLDSAISVTKIWKIYNYKEDIYFCSSNRIFIYNKLKLKKQIDLPKHTLFTFLINGNFYVGVFKKGLTLLKNDSFQVVKNGVFFKNKNIFGIEQYNEQTLLVATGTKGVYLYNIKTGDVKQFISDKDMALFNGGMIYNVKKLYDGNFIFTSVLGGGAVVFDKNGNVVYAFTKKTGFPDNFVYFAYQDNGPVWLGLNTGLVKVDYNIPINEIYPAKQIDGTINSIKFFKDILYIASDAGVYYIDNTEEFPKLKSTNIKKQVWSFEIYNSGDKSTLLANTNQGIYTILDTNNILSPGEIGINNINVKRMLQYKNKLVLFLNNSVMLYKKDGEKWVRLSKKDDISAYYYFKDSKNIWIFTVKNKLLQVKVTDSIEVVSNYDFSNINIDVSGLIKYDNKIYISSYQGLFSLNQKTKKLEKVSKEIPFADKEIHLMKYKKDKLYVTTQDNKINHYYIYNTKTNDIDSTCLKYLPESNYESIITTHSNYIYIFIGRNIYMYNSNKKPVFISPPKVLMEKSIAKDKVFFNNYYILSDSLYNKMLRFSYFGSKVYGLEYKYNNLKFYFTLPYYFSNDKTKYSYMLEGNDNEWSSWSKENFAYINNLTEGKYTLLVKAKNVFGLESDVFKFKFEIYSPWYRTVWAYIIYFILIVGLIVLIVYLNNRRLIKEKIQLEKIVKERTAEVVAQKEEIEQQKEEIEQQKDIVVAQKERIEAIHQEITDSIYYARRIQRAILPREEHVNKAVPEHFILFKPKDIVSGDYYWASIIKEENAKREDLIGKLVITAADCTGHGVPGAFMSMLGVSFLNEIVNEKGVTQANTILNMMRENVISSLQQTGADGEQKDGMDIALLSIDMETMHIQYAGANNPLYLIRHKDKPKLQVLTPDSEIKEYEYGDYILYEFKGDKMPIAIHVIMNPFRLNEFVAEPGDTLYIFSDGFADQFGGPKGKKFKYKPFKNLLLQNQHLSMNEQKEILNNAIEEWKSHINPYNNAPYEQIDDIVVIGIKIP